MNSSKYRHLKYICLACFIILLIAGYEALYAKNNILNSPCLSKKPSCLSKQLPKQEIAELYSDRLPISIERLNVFSIANDQATQIHLYFSRAIRNNQLDFRLSKDKKQLKIIMRGISRHTLVQGILDKIQTNIIKHICVLKEKGNTVLVIVGNCPISYKCSIVGVDVNITLEKDKTDLFAKPSYKHGKFYPVKKTNLTKVVASPPSRAKRSPGKFMGYSAVLPPTGLPPSVTTGKLSLNFQNIKIRSLVQLIAEFAHQNIVVSDSVKGNMSLHLSDLPWDQALNIVLKSQGLAKRKVGNVLMIAPQEEMSARELQELQAMQQAKLLIPLQSTIIRLHYARAKDLVTVLKDKSNTVLSDRGQVSVDIRTNTLWIKDTRDNILSVRHLVRSLDIPVRQVLIEARIVSLKKEYERNLGVKFGLSGRGRLNFDLGAGAISGTNPASVGLALFKVARGLYLDMELSALEEEGHIHIVSSPRIVTSNQQAAMIETGEEIPYQESTSSGATNTAFKKAVLSLHITPQITPHRKIILNLKVNEDRRGTASYTDGPPAIDTQQIETQVLLNDGETIVLGGVYKQTKQNVVTRVPFLGTLPIIGNLFKHSSKVDDRTELLIFITPRVINTVS
jgi:type II secretory pathway component GspD/PulD (secretin)